MGTFALGSPIEKSLCECKIASPLNFELWPHVEKIRQAGRPELGPLTTTFLISMSTPIINLPIERIQ